MSNDKPVPTLMTINPPLSTYTGTPLANPTKYRALVGSLQYLSLTRLNISFDVNRLSQYMYKPTKDNWVTLKWLLLYVTKTTTPVYYFVMTCPLLYLFFPMLIGQVIKMTIFLQLVILSTYGEIQYLGVITNNIPLLPLQQKLSTDLLLPPLRRSYGSITYFVNSAIHPPPHQSFTVIIWVLHMLL